MNQPATKKRVLIVEDEEELRSFMERTLSDIGYEVIAVADGLEGLNKARHLKPDIILLDVMLPKLNGFAICRLLKYDQNYKNIPIVLWTWKEDDEDRMTGMASGADAYLPKPFRLSELLAVMENLLDRDKRSVKRTGDAGEPV